jgi:hypothetical protein
MIPLKLTALMSRLFQRDLLSHLQKCDPLCVTIYREKGKKPFINSYEHIDWNVSVRIKMKQYISKRVFFFLARWFCYFS